MPLRIAHVANEPFGVDAANGVQHVVYCLAQAQSDLGASVAVFTRDDDAVHIFDRHRSTLPVSPTLERSAVYPLRARLLSRYFEPKLAEKVVRWQPDIVHFHSIHIPQNIALAADIQTAGIPYCVTVHGALFRVALQRERLKKAIFRRLFELGYLNRARFIHALTPREAQAIRESGVRRPVIVVPNGLPPDSLIQPSRNEALCIDNPSLRGRRLFTFIGRLDPWQKGLDLVVDAFAQAALQNWALVLVGPDYRGSTAALAARVERLGIRHSVFFIGPRFGPQRADVLAASDVFVHPSRWEGLSLSVLAAAAAAKPCLITREADPCGKLEEGRGAIVVEPTVSSIVTGMRRAASLSGAELNMMGERAHSVVREAFRWSAAAEALVGAYAPRS